MFGSKSSSPGASAASEADQPVALTVHSLPTPGAGPQPTLPNTRMGRWKLLLLFVMSASPVIASYYTYYVIRPEGRRNYGELIDPQKALPDYTAEGLQGESVPLVTLKGQWLLVTVADSACAEACQRNLYLSRQLREALGKDKDRVDWVWLRTGEAPVPQALVPALQSATALKVDAAVVNAWLAPEQGAQLSDHVYVVDPMGHWMMRFPANPDPAKARKDLERLMRGSTSWDRAGRD